VRGEVSQGASAVILGSAVGGEEFLRRRRWHLVRRGPRCGSRRRAPTCRVELAHPELVEQHALLEAVLVVADACGDEVDVVPGG